MNIEAFCPECGESMKQISSEYEGKTNILTFICDVNEKYDGKWRDCRDGKVVEDLSKVPECLRFKTTHWCNISLNKDKLIIKIQL